MLRPSNTKAGLCIPVWIFAKSSERNSSHEDPVRVFQIHDGRALGEKLGVGEHRGNAPGLASIPAASQLGLENCVQAYTLWCRGLLGPLSESDHMPTILRSGPYRVYFYSHETKEPPHVHVDRDHATCKFWLCPVSVADNLGFGPAEFRDSARLIEDQVSDFLAQWEAFHGESG